MSASLMSETGQYLTFRLDDETFAVDIAQVREVLDFTAVTRVPQTPDYMLGVINLRGSAVPVVDMRSKLGMTRAEATVHSCIIIVEVEIDGNTVVLGALADSVQEVMDLDSDQVEPPPQIGTRSQAQFIKGMGRRGDRFLMILDIDRVFATDELIPAAEMGEVETDCKQCTGGEIVL